MSCNDWVGDTIMDRSLWENWKTIRPKQRAYAATEYRRTCQSFSPVLSKKALKRRARQELQDFILETAYWNLIEDVEDERADMETAYD